MAEVNDLDIRCDYEVDGAEDVPGEERLLPRIDSPIS